MVSKKLSVSLSVHLLQTLTPIKVNREVTNCTKRKNLHTPVYGVKKIVCLSVHLLQTLTPIISRLAEQNGLKFACLAARAVLVSMLRKNGHLMLLHKKML